MSDLKKALLIQTAFIGDVILTTPMIAAFKHFFPDASLTVLVKPEAVALLSENPAVDEVLVIDKKRNHRGPAGMLRMAREIRSRHFDILLSPHQSHRTSLLAMFSRIPERYGYGSAGFARLAYTHRLRRNTQRIEIDRLLDFLADALRVNTAECPRDLKIFVNDSARQEARQLLRDLDVRRPILLGPSSVWPTKRWTAWGFARLANDLIRRYRSPVLLVGAPGDREINDRV
ncbi:MAG: glycosyltransferase family 9 protein, partial [Leptospiraceae bacterium]|nr:glycosyltransferase family 9 protein [Leptospiraceae bacterium]